MQKKKKKKNERAGARARAQNLTDKLHCDWLEGPFAPINSWQKMPRFDWLRVNLGPDWSEFCDRWARIYEFTVFGLPEYDR